MRIESNSNLAFGAYFKNNTIFKNLYAKSSKINGIDKELVDTFRKCPDHEIEIISVEKDSFRSIAGYTLFNNNTGGSCYFTSPTNSYENNIINDCIKACLQIPTDSVFDNFWGSNKQRSSQTEEIYKTLTNQK